MGTQSLPTYDGDVMMFREVTRSADLGYLRFLRWLIEQGRLEHLPSGPPSGELAQLATACQPAGMA